MYGTDDEVDDDETNEDEDDYDEASIASGPRFAFASHSLLNILNE